MRPGRTPCLTRMIRRCCAQGQWAALRGCVLCARARLVPTGSIRQCCNLEFRCYAPSESDAEASVAKASTPVKAT